MRGRLVVCTVLVSAGCQGSNGADVDTTIEHGARIFHDATAVSSVSAGFACADCHRASEEAGTRIWPGGDLRGVVERPTFWGGQENDLWRAINDCRTLFMRAAEPWSTDDQEARALYGYLASLPPLLTGATSFTPVRAIATLPCASTSEAAGANVFRDACEPCHGTAHHGENRKSTLVPVLPEQALALHGIPPRCDAPLPPAGGGAGFGGAPGGEVFTASGIFLSKIRHGVSFGEGGTMPPFSKEVLSDEQISDLFTYFGFGPQGP